MERQAPLVSRNPNLYAMIPATAPSAAPIRGANQTARRRNSPDRTWNEMSCEVSEAWLICTPRSGSYTPLYSTSEAKYAC